MTRGEPGATRFGMGVHAVLIFLVLGMAGCGSRAAPSAGASTGLPPDLRGQQVMVFPAQTVHDGIQSADQELAYALQARGESTGWLLPEDLLEFLSRAPGVQVRIDALPVGIFMQAEVNRVGDPLYGDLRRLAALTGADIALIPIEVRLSPGSEDVAGAGDGAPSGGSDERTDTVGASMDGSIEIAAALLSARTGRVYWFGIVQGEPGEAGDPRVLASVADSLARRIIR